MGAAEAAAKAGDPTEAVRRWRAVLAHPCAHHQIIVSEVREEICQQLKAASRWDEAITAKREAIAAGWRSEPDAEADIADLHLLAGRRGEGDRIYAQLRERDPDDA